jgi:hypothetical protein
MQLERFSLDWRLILKLMREVGCEGVKWFELAANRIYL